MAQQWNDFRRALRKDDREAFDSLIDRARMHASASTFAVSLDPVESALLSMLLEHEKMLVEVRAELSRGKGGGVDGVLGRSEEGG